MKTVTPDGIFPDKRKKPVKKKWLITFGKKDLDIFGIPLYNKECQKFVIIRARTRELALKELEKYRGDSYRNILDFDEPVKPILFLSDNMMRVDLDDIDINGDYWLLRGLDGSDRGIIRTERFSKDEETVNAISRELVSLLDIKNKTQLEIVRDIPYGQKRYLITVKKDRKMIAATIFEKRMLSNATKIMKL
jgi:hypothetical protein